MYTNTNDYWPKDPTRIDLKNEAELKFWEERFKTSATHIVEAVREVGPITIAVDNYLKQQIAA